MTYRGRPCGAQSSLSDLGVVSGSTLDIALRLRGGGGDGGATGAESRISYLEMYASKKPDKVRPRSLLQATKPCLSGHCAQYQLTGCLLTLLAWFDLWYVHSLINFADLCR